MPLRIDVNLKGFDRATRAMLRAGANVRKPFSKSRRDTRKDQREHMREQAGPKGRKWKSLAPSTRERRLGLGGRRNKFTKKGRLKKRAQRQLNRILSRKMISARNTKIKVGRNFIKVTARIGEAHQKGKRVGKRSKLPKRPFLYFSPELQKAIRDRIAIHLADAFNKS